MKKRVLFFCLGNICRSPLAEGLFKKYLHQEGLSELIEVDSAGTSRYNLGERPDPRTLKNARLHGVELNHRARVLIEKDGEDFDLIIGMDEQNIKAAIQTLPASAHGKLKLLRDFDPEGSGIVPDPWYGNEDGFEEVYQIVNRCMKPLVAYCRAELLLQA